MSYIYREKSRGIVDITMTDHLTILVDASIKKGRGEGCIAITMSNIRQTFVIPAISEDANNAEFEGIVCSLQLLMLFKNWTKLRQVKICSDNEVAIKWANEQKSPLDSLIKSCFKRAPNLAIKFHRLHKTHNLLQHNAARTWLKIVRNPRLKPWAWMVVKTKVLTRVPEKSRSVVGYKDGGVRDLAPPTPAEPLNATVERKLGLSPRCKPEGRSTGRNRQPAIGIGRVPVVSASGKPLMPCKPSKARKLLARNLAEQCWNRLGQFYLRLRFDPKSEPNRGQHVCLAVDTGSKWDGLAVLTREQVLMTAELVLPSGIAKKLEVRRQMRRARRYRKTPRRAKRFDNRRRQEGWLAPSQKAKVDFRIKIVDELCRLYPIDRFAVEDVRFNHYKKRWGKFFSTVEIGKTRFYEHLRMLGSLNLYSGVQTAEWREHLGLPKNSRKSILEWDAHASDAVAIGCAEIGCTNPAPPEFWVWKRFQNARRQLHRFEPGKGGVRRRYGGSLSIYPFKKSDVVLWRGQLARIGGHRNGGISLHTFTLKNKRIKRDVRPGDCERLFNQTIFAERSTPIPPTTEAVGSIEGF